MNAPLKANTLINPFLQPSAPTLADVARQIAAMSLNPTRKRDYLSALRRLGELLHKPLSNLTADAKVIPEHLENARPALAQLSLKTQANLRPNALAALDTAGFSQVLRTAKISRTPEWLELVPSLPDRRFRDGLSRFTRFCSGNNIPPQQVDTTVLLAFAEALRTSTFAHKTDMIVRDTATLWNRIASAHPISGCGNSCSQAADEFLRE